MTPATLRRAQIGAVFLGATVGILIAKTIAHYAGLNLF